MKLNNSTSMTGLGLGALALFAIWWVFFKPTSTSTASASTVTAPPSPVDCMSATIMPWINDPRKSAFMTWVSQNKTTDPVWTKSDGCSWWAEYTTSH